MHLRQFLSHKYGVYKYINTQTLEKIFSDIIHHHHGKKLYLGFQIFTMDETLVILSQDDGLVFFNGIQHKNVLFMIYVMFLYGG